MNVTITPAALGGAVTPPPSKSQAHRLIIAAALSDGVCRLSNVELSQDIQATLRCMRTLDADASADGTVIRGADLVDGFETPPPEIMDCGESGSTLRFLIPVALALKGGGRFTGHGRLMERPQEPYFRLFTEKGIAWSLENGVLAVEGRLTPGVYALPGDVSSQFITGLLYALPLLEGDSELVLTTALESRGYVDMTLDALAQFGVSAEYDGDRRFRVPGNQVYRHRDLAIEGDWSNAAFWFAAAFLGHRVDVEGLNPRSVQGDRVIGEQLARLTRPGPAELDVSQCPDLVPPLAAMAALRAGEWSSKVARDGLWHKLGAVVAVLVAAILDGVIGLILANIPALELPFRYEVFASVLVLVWYIMTELGSIVENVGALGAPVPAWLRKAIAALESTVDGAGDKLGSGQDDEK